MAGYRRRLACAPVGADLLPGEAGASARPSRRHGWQRRSAYPCRPGTSDADEYAELPYIVTEIGLLGPRRGELAGLPGVARRAAQMIAEAAGALAAAHEAGLGHLAA